MNDQQPTDPDGGWAVRGSRVALLFVGLFATAIVYVAIAMPGMDHSPSSSAMPGMDHGESAMTWIRQSPADFADTVAGQAAVVINVHVPDEGGVAGTDLAIPYTDIVGSSALPRDKGTPLALYCRSGRMSTIAAQALVGAGYTNLVELDGGLDAWERAGLTVQP